MLVTVKNSWGVEVDYEAAVILMDDDIREELHKKMAPCTKQDFFEAYAKAHEEKFNEIWVMDEESPQY